MENSCKENLKQSSKKWVIASCYPKAGNCPVRYIDPDGRASVGKTYYNKYCFEPDFCVLDKGVSIFFDKMMPFGSRKIMDWVTEMERIEPAKKSSITDYVDLSILSYSSKKLWHEVGEGASIFSWLEAGKEIYFSLHEQKRVATEWFIDFYFSAELTSTSRENVERLYDVALFWVLKLEAAGYIKIEPDFFGNLKEEKVIGEEGKERMELLRSILKSYRETLEREE